MGSFGRTQKPSCKVAGDPFQTQSLGAQLGSTYPPGLGLNAPECAPHQDHHELVGGTHVFSERFRE